MFKGLPSVKQFVFAWAKAAREIYASKTWVAVHSPLSMRETISTARASISLESRVAIRIKRTCSLCKCRLRIHTLGDVGKRFSTLGALCRYNSCIRLREWPHFWLGYYTMRVRLFVCKSEGYARVVTSRFRARTYPRNDRRPAKSLEMGSGTMINNQVLPGYPKFMCLCDVRTFDRE